MLHGGRRTLDYSGSRLAECQVNVRSIIVPRAVGWIGWGEEGVSAEGRALGEEGRLLEQNEHEVLISNSEGGGKNGRGRGC